ncbi:hypothetical protein D3C87_1702030 [compost metagenome]
MNGGDQLVDGVVGNEASAYKKEVNAMPSRVFEEFRECGKVNFIRIKENSKRFPFFCFTFGKEVCDLMFRCFHSVFRSSSIKCFSFWRAHPTANVQAKL